MKNRIKRKIIVAVKRNMRWIILLLCIIAFLAIAEDVLENEIWRFDDNVYNIVSKLISEPLTIIFKIITNLGGAIGILSITACIFIFLKNKKYGYYTLLNLGIVVVMNQVLKFIVQRPRPTEFRIIQEGGYSFPSGHSMASMAFYGFLIYFIYHKVENKYLKWGLCTMLSLLILTIGVSRIYLGVHYASDVFAGFCLSISYLILYTKIIGKNFKKIN